MPPSALRPSVAIGIPFSSVSTSCNDSSDVNRLSQINRQVRRILAVKNMLWAMGTCPIAAAKTLPQFARADFVACRNKALNHGRTCLRGCAFLTNREGLQYFRESCHSRCGLCFPRGRYTNIKHLKEMCAMTRKWKHLDHPSLVTKVWRVPSKQGSE